MTSGVRVEARLGAGAQTVAAPAGMLSTWPSSRMSGSLIPLCRASAPVSRPRPQCDHRQSVSPPDACRWPVRPRAAARSRSAVARRVRSRSRWMPAAPTPRGRDVRRRSRGSHPARPGGLDQPTSSPSGRRARSRAGANHAHAPARSAPARAAASCSRARTLRRVSLIGISSLRSPHRSAVGEVPAQSYRITV